MTRMTLEAIADAVVRLPRRFGEENVSAYQILQETGYFEQHNAVSEELLLRALSKDPRYADEWIQYSDDKRTDSGWFFREIAPGDYLVAYFPKGRTGPGQETHQTRYADKLAAVAAFVKHAVEMIRE